MQETRIRYECQGGSSLGRLIIFPKEMDPGMKDALVELWGQQR